MVSVRKNTDPLLDGESFLELGAQFLALAQHFLYEQRPLYRPMPAEVIARVRNAALPAHPLSTAQLREELHLLQDYATFGSNHPCWYGAVGGGVNEWGVLASIFATALNPNCLGGDQSSTYAELAVVRWLAELTGFPQQAGLLVSGASQAALTALAAARQVVARQCGVDVRVQGLAGLPPLIVYASDQTHPSLAQQANILGLGGLHVISSDPWTCQIRVDELRQTIVQDRQDGKLPCCVIGNAGTTSTGSIDPLAALADLCAAERLWLHVDGAYGAFGVLDERIKACYAGIERADSLAVDAHKWLAVPYESGCLLVRSSQTLQDAFGRPAPAYVQPLEEHPHFSEWGLQMSRGPRALVLWIVLRTLGREGARALVTRARDLAALLAREIAALPGMRVLAPIELSTVCFRAEPPELVGQEEQIRACNQRLLQRLQQSQQAYPMATMLHGQYALRACVLHPRTSVADIQQLLALLRLSTQEGESTGGEEGGECPC
jgi:glutamate/tyrosine decarboxylase-like PLP-dependent enzyme